MLTVGSLFSGIGGLDLGLERAGMKTIWQSEIDPYASQVLKKHWPEVPNHGDIKKINWREVERPDVICGGYPCQPFSTAGKRQGEQDPRHLWPWVRECIGVLRPRYAILENVQGHLSLGGTTVLREITELGYDAEWRIVSAASVGANHRRNRLIIVAYPRGERLETTGPELETPRTIRDSENSREPMADANDARGGTPAGETNRDGETPIERREIVSLDGVSRRSTNVADTPSEGLQGPIGEVYERRGDGFTYGGWQWWETEPNVGRVANGVPSRVDRLKCLGNAVVPQVAEVIGRLVVEHSTR